MSPIRNSRVLVAALALTLTGLIASGPAALAEGTGVVTNTATPTISGNPVVGNILTTTAGTWTGDPSYTYQWQVCSTTPTASTFGATGTGPVGLAVDPAGYAYVGNRTASSVSKISQSGRSAVIASTGSNPNDLAVDPSGIIFTANFTGNTVTKLVPNARTDTMTTTYTRAATYSGFVGPDDVVFDAAGNVYVPNYNGGSISKIDTSGVVSIFATMPGPFKMVFDSVGNLYATSAPAAAGADAKVHKFLPDGSEVVGGGWPAYVGGQPYGIVADSRDNLWVSNVALTTVAKITPLGAKTTYNIGAATYAIAIDSADNVYTANFMANSVSRITPAGRVSLYGYTTGSAPRAITVDSVGDVYTSNMSGNNVTVFRLCQNITGETGTSYIPTSDMLGKKVRVIVTASNTTGSARIASAQYGPIVPAPAPVTVTASNETSTYGSPLSAVGYTATGLASDDWFTALDCDAYSDTTTTTALTGGEKPGTYSTVCKGDALTGKGAVVTFISGSYTITKASLTLSAASKTWTYGQGQAFDTNTDWSVTAGSLVNGDTWATQTLTLSPSADPATAGAGRYTITPGGTLFSGETLTDYYDVIAETGTLTVNKAHLIIKATDVTIERNEPVTRYPWSGSGFVPPDTSTSYSTEPVCSSTGDTKTVGDYPITCTGGDWGPNYETSTVDGLLRVLPPILTVVPHAATSMYGSSPSSITYEIRPEPDTPTQITDSTTCSAPVFETSTPRTYEISCSGGPGTASLDDTTTSVLYDTSTYTVTKAPLTIAVANASVAYGSYAGPLFTETGWVNGDTTTVTAAASASFSCRNGQPCVGVYTLTPQVTDTLTAGVCTSLSACYTLTTNPGTLTITPAALTVTAANQSIKFGSDVPANAWYTHAVTGFVNGEDTSTALGEVTITCTSAYTMSTPSGTRLPITCSSGGTPHDYTITFVAGTLTVQAAGIAITNTTSPFVTTSTNTAPVTLSANLLQGLGYVWTAGCQVVFTLDPSGGTSSPYTAYPSETNTADPTTAVTLSVELPIGVYNILITLEGSNCERAAGAQDPDGVLVVAPLNGGTGSTGGGWYKAVAGGPKQSFGYVVQLVSKTTNSTTKLTTYQYKGQSEWTVQGGSQMTTAWRLKASLKQTVVKSDTSGAIVSGVPTYGTFACPSVWTDPKPVSPFPYCASIMGQAVLQYRDATGQWVPYTMTGGGLVNFTITIYDGGWIQTCKNKVCQTTDLSDWYGITMRSLPGAPVVPAEVPQSVPVTMVKQGQIIIWP